MSTALLADCLISGLAGLALLGLRVRLRRVGLTPRLMRTLRLATGLWGVFYLLRIPAWMGQADLGNRLLLAVAAFIPLSLVLVAEAALRRHAPPVMKWGLLIGTPLLVIGAILAPSSAAGTYLPVLLGFQLLFIAGIGWFVWHFAAALSDAEAKQMRAFGGLALLSLPLVATDFIMLGTGSALHLSALVVLIAVWLAVSSGSWMTGVRPAVCAVGCLAVLAALGALALNGGWVMWVTLLAVLIFAALLADAARLASGGLGTALAELLARPRGDLTEAHLAETLSGRDAVLLSEADLKGFDAAALAEEFRNQPLWAAPGRGRDLDEQMAALARRTGVSHMVAVGQAPLRLIGFTLGPSQMGGQVETLLKALGRRMSSESAP
ncbi:hypothetical protein [Roseovarius sp. 2305UL8-3]|uniref:hypothetical protein n=1 Tax=Roseovarius conchicola TaxID=3121636 RepID=UPI00352997DE